MREGSLPEKVSVESLVARVADEFLERQKNGERPDIEEYAARYPEAAELLRNVLVALELIATSQIGGAGLSESATEPAGTLGDFRILREVGKGGMGVVYEAEQISLRRRVALKVLPFAATMDPRQLQRFQNEARAAACLHHPHIVPVYFVGCERGVHFYAMQFIDGQSLEGFLRQLHHTGVTARTICVARAADRDQPGPISAAPDAVTVMDSRVRATTQPAPQDAAYFRQVAEWGIAIAEALEHAHSLGIVHRDIKPGNLLLDTAGRLWVTDFGLARTVNDAGLTLTGDLMGTLRYMSPEQALAKHGLVDHRTDIYSLGVTLYELLTLRPAIDGLDREEILNAITRDEPRPLRTVDTAIPHDLETIVLKAMAKEPAERYATARDLAEDLRRFMMHEPIRAKRANIFQRARKWAYRHKSAVEAAAFVLVLAMIGLVIGTYLIWQKEAETRTALELVEKQRRVALANEAKAKALQRQAEVHLDRAFNDMRGLLKALDKKELAEISGIDKVRQELAVTILRHYESYLDEQSADPEVRLWTSRAYGAVSDLQTDPRKRIELQIKAVTIAEALTREFPTEVHYWRRLAHNRFGLRGKLLDQGLKAQAMEQSRQAMDAFETAARLAPNDVSALNTLAWLLAQIDDPTIRNPERAVVLARKAVELDPDNVNVWDTLGVACYQAGICGEAVTALEKSLALLAKKGTRAALSTSLRSDNVDSARSKLYLSLAYSRLGKVPKARLWYDRAVQWMDKNGSQDGELRRLRAEAADLLGIQQQPPAQNMKASPRR